MCKSLPHHPRASTFRVRHLQIPKTLGTRTLEKVGVSHGGIPGETAEMDPAGELVSSPRGLIGAERVGEKGAGAAGGSGEEGRGAVARPPPLPSLRACTPPLSLPGRSPERVPPRPGYFKGRRQLIAAAGSNGDLGGGADVARACVVVST